MEFVVVVTDGLNFELRRAKYGVSLERGPFDKRTADYVWMFIFGAFSLLVCVKSYCLYNFSSVDFRLKK